MPRQRQVPPTTQKGTSAPTRAPSSTSSCWGRPAWNIWFRPWSTAAASALPPPMPARLGMYLRMWMESPCPVMPQRSKKYCAARKAVFLVSTGRYSRLQNSRMPGLLIFLISTSSHTETVCITVSKVW